MSPASVQLHASQQGGAEEGLSAQSLDYLNVSLPFIFNEMKFSEMLSKMDQLNKDIKKQA